LLKEDCVKNKKLTLADIAQLACVSKSTVSFVLNGHAQKHRITQETIDKVQAVVSEHNYTPSLYARALKAKRTYTVGLIIPDLANLGFANIAKQLEVLCRSHQMQLLIASSEDDYTLEVNAVNSLIDRQVDALMVASSMLTDEYYQQVNQTIPVVLFDRTFSDSTLPSVCTDSSRATQILIERLLVESKECLYLGGQQTLSTSVERLKGFTDAQKAKGISDDSMWVMHQDYQPESGYTMLSSFVKAHGRLPKALFTASYSLLEGVLKYLSEYDALNENIQIGTFDDYRILDCLPINIHSIAQDCEGIAGALFQLVETLSNHKKLEKQHVIIQSHVRFR